MLNVFTAVRRIGLAAWLVCLLIVLSPTAHGQGFTITNLTNSTASNNASFPSMMVDSGGNLNLVWVDKAKGVQFIRSTTSASGTSFGTPPSPTTVPGSSGQALPVFQPQIAVYMTQVNVVEIVWAAKDPAFTPATPLYDVFASRSNQAGAVGTFVTTMIVGPPPASGPAVALFDSPRLAFDFSGATNVVWGQHDVLISRAQDGIHFSVPVSIALPPVPPATSLDTGGPRIAVSSDNHIFVVWTDEASKSTPTGNYCYGETTDQTGLVVTNTFGGNFFVNEIFPAATAGGAVVITPANTRNLSQTDWVGVNSKFPQGFFGCSYDNLTMYTDKIGFVHLLWSDDQPLEDVLTSEPHGTDANGFRKFSFPINLANVPAASPSAAVDAKGSFYVVWSGGPNGGAGSQGIYFTRSDDAGSTFTTQSCPAPNCPAQNIAPKAIAPAFPQVAVDANSNVNIVWEQATAPLKYDGTDMFNVFFARSTDRGNTFPTILQVSSSPSVFCFKPAGPPESLGFSPGTATPTAPDVSTCGTAQIAVGANSAADMAWVNQASANAVADINFAVTGFPTGSVSPSSASLSASNRSQQFTVTVNPGGFSGPITFSCMDADTNAALPAWLTCSFSPPTLNPTQSNTDMLTITRAGTPTSGILLSAPRPPNTPPYSIPAALTLVFAILSFTAMVALFIRRRQQTPTAVFVRGLAVMVLTVVLATALVSCGGSTSSPSSTTTTGTSGTGSGGTGGTGGNTVTVHVAVLAQSGSGSSTNLGTVTITAQ